MNTARLVILAARILLCQTDCVAWDRARHDDGYGVVRHPLTGRVSYAHRVSLEMVAGAPAEGMEAHHECKNPSCVNALHLRWVTVEEHAAIHGGRRY